MQFEYRGQLGSPFGGWLHVDFSTLAEHAERWAWACRVVRLEENGDHLARLPGFTKRKGV